VNSLTALLAAVVGYLIGSISPARVITARVAPQQDITKLVVEGVDGGGRFESDSVSSGSVRLHLGNRYGCLVGVLDILKGAIPTLILKWWLPDQPYHLLAAGMVVVGHNWPLYYGFKGGRGVSPSLGAMLVIDPLGVVVTNILGLASDLFIRLPLLSSGVWLELMVPWTWIVGRSWPERLYVLAMALIYSVSIVPEVREVIRLKREGNLEALQTARELRVSSRVDGGTAIQASVPDLISDLLAKLKRENPGP